MVNNQKHVLLTASVLLFLPLLVSAQWLETTMAVGDGPIALVYNPTNNKVYCANAYSDNVTVIDGVSDSVITTIAVGSWPRAFARNPVQNRTYVANYYSSSVSVIRDSMVGVEENTEIATPSARHDFAVYPNPFKEITDIRYQMRDSGYGIRDMSDTEIKIYDATGRLVKQWDYPTIRQSNQICWDGRDDQCRKLQSGVYFLKLEAGDYCATEKLLLVK